MPRRHRPGEWAILYAELPPDLKDRLEQFAKSNRRSTTAELIVLLETHLPPKRDPDGKNREGGK